MNGEDNQDELSAALAADNPPVPSDTEQAEPDVQNEYQDGMASVFANPKDLWRYRVAIAHGATEKEALKVGDNGLGAWGDRTATYKTPMVALPSDTPGLKRGLPVEIEGPKGRVIAIVADKMPATNQLEGQGNIDLNPAAALAVGHNGGVEPVKWRFLGSDAVSQMPNISAPESISIPQNPAVPPTAASSYAGPLPTNVTPVGEQDGESDIPPEIFGGDQTDESGIQPASLDETGQPPQSQPAASFGVLGLRNAKVAKRNPDGSVTASDGTTMYPDGSVVIDRGGQKFYKPYRGNWQKLAGQRDAEQLDTATLKALSDVGVSPTDEQGKKLGRTQAWDLIRQKKSEQTGEDIPTSLTGNEFLTQLPTKDQDMVKAIAEGRISPKQLGRSQDRLRMINLASRYDPSFDTSVADQRSKLRSELGSTRVGTLGGNLRSLNQALHHLGTLYDRAQELPGKDLIAANSLENFFKTQTGQPFQKSFEQARHQVANEVERFFTGGVPSVSGVSEWEKRLSAANSKEQLNQIITRDVPELLSGGFRSLEGSWRRTMGNTPIPNDKPFIDNDTQTVIQKLGAGHLFDTEGAATPQATPTSTPIAPVAKLPAETATSGIQAAKRILANPSASTEDKQRAQAAIDLATRMGVNQ